MGTAFLYGNGGSGGVGGLNFKVVGNPQPSNPKENTIWIDTDQKITGWEFSAAEPYPNLVKSSFVNSNKNVYAGVLYVDFDLQPNTTYTMFFNGQDGNNYYINERLFKKYTVVKVGAERTAVHFTTKDTDISGSYTDEMGWLILKNDKTQTSDHVFDNIYIVEGDSEIDPEGMVWISTGTSSAVAFNALKKNGIQVYPISAKQYVSGAWVDVTAQSYQDGKWVNWLPRGALYWDGIQVVEWIKKSAVSQSGWTALEPVYNSDSVTLDSEKYANQFCGIVTKDKIDVTGYSKLVVEVEGTASASDSNTIQLCISSKQSNFVNEVAPAYKKIEAGFTGSVELPFTVSGSYYIDIFTIRTASLTIKRVYLE